MTRGLTASRCAACRHLSEDNAGLPEVSPLSLIGFSFLSFLSLRGEATLEHNLENHPFSVA